MSHYSDDVRNVRVDFFKPTGKWYETECVHWSEDYQNELLESFRVVLAKHLKGRMQSMSAVCLEPYNIHSHPVMVTVE